MVLPDSSLYKDFNSETDFVDLKMENIEVYLKPMEKTIDSDAKNLYKEMFLLCYLVNCLSTGNKCRTVICCAAVWNSYQGKLLTLVSHSCLILMKFLPTERQKRERM